MKTRPKIVAKNFPGLVDEDVSVLFLNRIISHGLLSFNRLSLFKRLGQMKASSGPYHRMGR
jgi:hypothetical protein